MAEHGAQGCMVAEIAGPEGAQKWRDTETGFSNSNLHSRADIWRCCRASRPLQRLLWTLVAGQAAGWAVDMCFVVLSTRISTLGASEAGVQCCEGSDSHSQQIDGIVIISIIILELVP